jgi:DNA-binding MarR family transcriptional regulator
VSESTHGSDRLVAAVEKIAQVRRALVQEIATDHGLSPLQVEVVRLLAASPPPAHRSTDLAVELAVSTATLTDALQALRRKGLIRDKPDPEDGRRKTLQLGPRGRSVALAIQTRITPFVNAANSLSEPVVSDAVVALLQVIRRLYDEGVVSTDRSCATCAHRRMAGGPHGSCALLGISLTPTTLRVRCADHQPAA